jgi:hypothetical protein
MPLFQKAVFLTTVANLRDFLRIRCVKSLLPVAPTPEIFCHQHAGRPCPPGLCQQDPGRTQHLNYFTLADGKYFVDLPGYGFAKAPEAIRSQWEGLIGPYLSKREQLAGLVVIMDSGGHDRSRYSPDRLVPPDRTADSHPAVEGRQTESARADQGLRSVKPKSRPGAMPNCIRSSSFPA